MDVTHTCHRCGHTADVSEFIALRYMADGTRTTVYKCAACGAMRTVREKV